MEESGKNCEKKRKKSQPAYDVRKTLMSAVGNVRSRFNAFIQRRVTAGVVTTSKHDVVKTSFWRHVLAGKNSVSDKLDKTKHLPHKVHLKIHLRNRNGIY